MGNIGMGASPHTVEGMVGFRGQVRHLNCHRQTHFGLLRDGFDIRLRRVHVMWGCAAYSTQGHPVSFLTLVHRRNELWPPLTLFFFLKSRSSVLSIRSRKEVLTSGSTGRTVNSTATLGLAKPCQSMMSSYAPSCLGNVSDHLGNRRYLKKQGFQTTYFLPLQPLFFLSPVSSQGGRFLPMPWVGEYLKFGAPNPTHFCY